MFLKLTLAKLSKVIWILYIKVEWHICNNEIYAPIFTKIA